MSPSASLVSLHLAGEEQIPCPDDLTLDTLPGKFTLTRTDAALTAYGGLVAWSAFLKHLGLIERLAQRCPVSRSSPNAAPVREVLHSFALCALVEGKRFCHVRWLTDDPALATVMNMDRVRGEDALPRLAKGMSVEPMREWMQQPQTELYAALPERFIADWDSTVNTRYGHQEDAALGYNPHKRGRKSHHPLICVAARTRLCLHLEWRPGDTVSATDWQPAMEKLWSHPTIRERLWLNRGDTGFGQEAVMAWHEQAGETRPQYLFKLRLTSNVRRAIAKVPWPLWEGVPTLGCQQIAETTVKLHGWSRERRVVGKAEITGDKDNPRFIVTDLKGSPKALYERRYCARGEAENRIKEAQLDLFGRRASCHRFWANQLRLLLAALAYTLMINLRRHALAGTELAQACTATIRTRLLKIAAAIVRNTRRVRVMLASAHPLRGLYAHAAHTLASSP